MILKPAHECNLSTLMILVMHTYNGSRKAFILLDDCSATNSFSVKPIQDTVLSFIIAQELCMFALQVGCFLVHKKVVNGFTGNLICRQ